MKKLISAFLILSILLTLSACGGKSNSVDVPEQKAEETTITTNSSETVMTKEELLSIAEEVAVYEIGNAMMSNQVSAKAQYCNKPFILTGKIWAIKDEYAQLYSGNLLINVRLPIEELIKVETTQQITVVGVLGEDIEEKTENISGMPWTFTCITMDNAYLVRDYYEISGKLYGVNPSFAPAWNILVPPEDSVLRLVYFNESVDTSTLEYNSQITISARIVNDDFHDASIISIVD